MLSREPLVQLLHRGVDPFEGFTYCKDDLDPQGWGSEHPIFEEIIDKFNRHMPVTIFEIGSWKGGSARHMASLLKKKSIDGNILCIDTWLAEEVLWSSAEWWPSLRLKNGRPNVYQTFMANTVEAGLQDYIVPLSMPSFNAARYIKQTNIKADIIYVDGCHVFEPALQDFKSYWPLLKHGGAMIVDDYHGGFPDVLQAVAHFGQPFEDKNGKCLICKP